MSQFRPPDPGAPYPPPPPVPAGYYYPAALPEHPQGTTVLVLGILSLLVGVTAPFAWYYGVKAEQEIRASGIRFSNTSQIQVGKVLGIVGTVMLGLGVLFTVGYLIVVFAVLIPMVGQLR